MLSHSVVFYSLWPHGLVACQAPLYMGFSRQEYWSGLPFPPPGHLLFLTLPTQNKVQMKLLSSLRIVMILLGSHSDWWCHGIEENAKEAAYNQLPVSVTLEATGLRPAAWWPWLCRALWKPCGWVSSSALSGRVSKPFHHLVSEKCMPLFKICFQFQSHNLFVCLFVSCSCREQGASISVSYCGLFGGSCGRDFL